MKRKFPKKIPSPNAAAIIAEERAQLAHMRDVTHSLMDYIDRIDGLEFDKIAVHVHMSRLQNQHRRPHYMQAAIKIFEHYVRRLDGKIFILGNQDIIFISKLDNRDKLEQVVIQMCDFFPNDPLIRMLKTRPDKNRFYGWYDLSENMAPFRAVIQKLMQDQKVSFQEGRTDLDETEFKSAATIEQFVDLIPMINKVNISDFIRSQSVCLVADVKNPHEVFHERFISIFEIQKTFVPNANLIESRWLFHYLTQYLDQKMLRHLHQDSDRLKSSFSVNMNMDSILSENFRAFEERISMRMRGKIIIEMQAKDMLSDIQTFLFARDFLRDLGFRVALDGLDHDTMSVLRLDRVHFDFYKIFWNTHLAALATGDGMKPIVENFKSMSPDNIILARCDSKQAIEVGQELGISLFQGNILDQILKQNKMDERRRVFGD